ncbi:MAG: M23 family metallopeptidase [Lachnospiraceae bacterium]|nr:M23 family metallopeptidase [Lachnospiraceae bacterium]
MTRNQNHGRSAGRSGRGLRLRYLIYVSSAAACFLWLLLMPAFSGSLTERAPRFSVTLNDVSVGILTSREEAFSCLNDARRTFARERLATQGGGLALSDAELSISNITHSTDAPAEADDPAQVTQAMLEVLRSNVYATLGRHYTVKIGDYSVNLADSTEVLRLLDTALAAYDPDGTFYTELIPDPTREVSVLTARVAKKDAEVDDRDTEMTVLPTGGTFLAMTEKPEVERSPEEMDFSEFSLGLYDMSFDDSIEVVEAYLPASELTDLATAIDEVTKDKETPQIYEVKSGDSLSVIAENYNLSLDALIAMNPTLDDASQAIRPEDELIVTVPEPELAVRYETEEYIEESYEAEVVIVPNDDWYTNQTQVLQEPSSGFHKVIARSTWVNKSEVARTIVKEEVTWEAVPMIMEKGTKVPPTFIKPISGGRLSSPFGKRSRPTKGASTYHKGIDWATPVGTAVVASSSGVVTRAGWGSGYGNVVYIEHPNGMVTRYGHLSRILVKTGQSVQQGQKIALSGNTGVSTGPHIHFEILVNGVQVNPMKYLN